MQRTVKQRSGEMNQSGAENHRRDARREGKKQTDNSVSYRTGNKRHHRRSRQENQLEMHNHNRKYTKSWQYVSLPLFTPPHVNRAVHTQHALYPSVWHSWTPHSWDCAGERSGCTHYSSNMEEKLLCLIYISSYQLLLFFAAQNPQCCNGAL